VVGSPVAPVRAGMTTARAPGYTAPPWFSLRRSSTVR
jgi:hypothetical protein